MNIIHATDLVTTANTWLTDKVKQYRAKGLYLPAGNTPKVLYDDWRRSPPPTLRGLEMYQLDEVRKMFALSFRQHLPQLKVHPPCDDVPKPTLSILGLGRNGHVAFHEPGIPRGFRFGRVRLSDDTASLLKVPRGTRAWTVGIGTLLETAAALLIVPGPEKWEVFQRACAGDERLPVRHLLEHPDLAVLTDQ